MKKNWVKLNLYYIGQSSKKHQIFRVKNWTSKLEKIFKQTVFNEKYEKIGFIKDIFGPIEIPFISIKTISDQSFAPNDSYFIKIM